MQQTTLTKTKIDTKTKVIIAGGIAFLALAGYAGFLRIRIGRRTYSLSQALKPDLIVSNITNENGVLSVKIGNVGLNNAPANKGGLNIWIDGQLKWTYSLSTLANQSFRSRGGFTIVQPQVLTGTHAIKAQIDPRNEISEYSKSNNLMEKTINFGERKVLLNVTRDALPTDMDIISNQVEVILASWNFDAGSSQEDVKIASIAWTGEGEAAIHTNRLRTFIDGQQLLPINDSLMATPGSTIFVFDRPPVIKKGKSAKIVLKGDKDSVSVGTENWGLTDARSIIALGVQSGNAAVVKLTPDKGPTLTSAASGKLLVDLETSGTPTSNIVLAGSKDNVFMNVIFRAENEDMRIEQFKISALDGNYPCGNAGEYKDIFNVSIYDGAVKIAEGDINSPEGRILFPNIATCIIPKGGSKTLTIKADMSTINPDADNAPGTNSADVKLKLSDIKAVGNISNALTLIVYRDGQAVESSPMILRNSKPIITQSTSAEPMAAATSLRNGLVNLLNFKVTADANGKDILLHKVGLNLYSPDAGIKINNILIKDANGNNINDGSFICEGGNVCTGGFGFDNPEVDSTSIKIPSGQSKTFYVWATVEGVSAGKSIISTLMMDDRCANVGKAGEVSPSAFVWSDNYKNLSISTAEADANAVDAKQWYNGDLLLNRQLLAPYAIYANY